MQQADARTILKVAAAGAAGGAVASAAMAVASGAATGWMVTKENDREPSQQSRRPRRG